MKLLGIVTLYYPEQDVIANIQSYLKYLDKLIVWDNTPISSCKQIILPENEKIIRERAEVNQGLGKPLNMAASFALENGYTHLLTMDQDSSFIPERFEKYLERIKTTTDKQICLFTPEISKEIPDSSSYQMEQVNATITSGSVYTTSIFKEIGLFRNDFFIDAIDTEYCFRIKKNHYQIARIKDVAMQHTLGQKIQQDFLCWHIESLNYSPLRTYYIIRNHLLVKSIYPEYNIRYILKLFLFKRFISILLIETDKLKKIRALFLGVIHGLIQKIKPFSL